MAKFVRMSSSIRRHVAGQADPLGKPVVWKPGVDLKFVEDLEADLIKVDIGDRIVDKRPLAVVSGACSSGGQQRAAFGPSDMAR